MATAVLPDPAGVEDYFISHAGIADNPGIPPAELAALRRQFANNPSQLAARERGEFVKPEGLILKRFDPADVSIGGHTESLSVEAVIALLKRCYLFAGLDPGKLRWAFTFFAATPLRKVYLIDEIFDQYGTLDSRARRIGEMMSKYHINRRFPIFADNANPTDIGEINQAFARLSEEEDKVHPRIGEMRAQAVGMDKKLVKPGILRVESLIVRNQFVVRRETGEGMTWRLGWNSQSEGEPQIGSRWLYEVGQWQWAKPAASATETVQKEEPNDKSADGADMMASTRYAIMSVIKKGKEPEGEDRQAFSKTALEEDRDKTMKIGNRLKRGRNKQREEIERAINDY